MRVVAQLILLVTWVAFIGLLVAANVRRDHHTVASRYERAKK